MSNTVVVPKGTWITLVEVEDGLTYTLQNTGGTHLTMKQSDTMPAVGDLTGLLVVPGNFATYKFEGDSVWVANYGMTVSSGSVTINVA